MNNDLISREALKKSIEEYRKLNCVSTSTIIGVRNVIYLIDNAPTVEPDEIYKKGYHNGFFATHDVPPTVEPTYISDMPDDKVKDLQELAIDYGEGIAVFERKRPQGEWIKQYGKSYELITNEGVLVGEFTKCPKCKYDKARGSNFCPNCGARMGGTTTLAIKALKLADEVEEASKKIGMRYYGPDICATCAHATPSTDHSTQTTFCEHYGLKVNDFYHCEHYKERRGET